MKPKESNEAPAFARLTKYYEHDGMLRAYANRAMLLAILFGVIAFASLGFAIYVRVQPPTVIRVDKDGVSRMTLAMTRNLDELFILGGRCQSPPSIKMRNFHVPYWLHEQMKLVCSERSAS